VTRVLRRVTVLTVIWLAVAVPAPAQRAAFDEREVKAVFLFNFVQFVSWPDQAFDGREAPIVIGILGEDPFGSVLDDVVKGELVRGRRLVVTRFRRVEDVKAHVLFVSRSEADRYEQVLAPLRAQSTLTVGETAGFTERGMIRFLTEQNRVRLEVNVGAAKAAGLTISSNLLRAARIVGNTRG
jgi:uncharacterized protein DUF4154